MIRLLAALGALCALFLTGCGGTDSGGSINRVDITVDGVTSRWVSMWGFGKLCVTTTYCASWSAPSSDGTRSVFTLGLPSDVATGKSYNSSSSGVDAIYTDSAGVKYVLRSNRTFTINVTKWPGWGFTQTGTASGVLEREDDPTKTITVTNATWQGYMYLKSDRSVQPCPK